MRLLTRYLFREILHYFLLFLAFTAVILMIKEIYDTREKFVENSPPILAILKFLIYSVPPILSLIMPMIGLLASVFAFGLLAKNREILAMVAAGVSFRQLSRPAFIFGLGLTAFMFWFNETVVPTSLSRTLKIEQVEIKGKRESIYTRRENVFVKGEGNRFYFMENYLTKERVMKFPTVLELFPDSAGISRRIDADEARLLPAEQGTGFVWNFTGAEVWNFNRDGSLANYQRYDGPMQYPMGEKLDKFLSKSKQPGEMNYSELKEYCDLLDRQGSRKDAQHYRVSLYQKLSSPIACLLMVLLGFAAVVDMHARHFARGFVLGLGLAVGYYLIQAFFTDMGEKEFLSPIWAAWPPVVVFAAVVYWVYLRLHRIRA